MRPLRFLLSLLSGFVAFILLLNARSTKQPRQHRVLTNGRSTLGAYFNWHTPSSLFPPSAIISLTDDNSTFFLARPAAFGPLLADTGLSAQLWVGSGFNDEHLGHNGEGELGCSDIPDWDDGKYWGDKSPSKDSRKKVKGGHSSDNKFEPRSLSSADHDDEDNHGGLSEHDGTDDYLHHPLVPSGQLHETGKWPGHKKPAHADIQSLQEGAEIAGKAVLLSRGGCGFLEKAKWVQRRGGIALIVGDDVRGGALVTMYAHGDTSNVTIPSVFTSRTTAHLLSSLMPSGGSKYISGEDAARLGVALGDEQKSNRKLAKDKTGSDRAKRSGPQESHMARTTSEYKQDHVQVESGLANPQDSEKKSGWLRAIWSSDSDNLENLDDQAKGNRKSSTESNGGDTVPRKLRGAKEGFAITPGPSKGSPRTPDILDDGFLIGVQDWRDADLVAEQRERLFGTSTSTKASPMKEADEPTGRPFAGGSVTPGSGEYAKSAHEAVDLMHPAKSSPKGSTNSKAGQSAPYSSKHWLNTFFSTGPSTKPQQKKPHPTAMKSKNPEEAVTADVYRHQTPTKPDLHEGLWVTITPTSMSASPFFDTLLVLVVSPLVTLTVVYGLLVLRSRIRRRRWRAPKSVVERLPVRTYQTMPSTTSSSTASNVSTPMVDATTPLLPSSARAIASRPRPRSQTTSEVPHALPGFSQQSVAVPGSSLEHIEEKKTSGLAEWRRKYGGKQRECVVCLEEYVDGVSRVMSLPCGHEFHAECITPWLTTRRRTCPICKGDVVRSLAKSSTSASSSISTAPPAYFEQLPMGERGGSPTNGDQSPHRHLDAEDAPFEDLENGPRNERS